MQKKKKYRCVNENYLNYFSFLQTPKNGWLHKRFERRGHGSSIIYANSLVDVIMKFVV